MSTPFRGFFGFPNDFTISPKRISDFSHPSHAPKNAPKIVDNVDKSVYNSRFSAFGLQKDVDKFLLTPPAVPTPVPRRGPHVTYEFVHFPLFDHSFAGQMAFWPQTIHYFF